MQSYKEVEKYRKTRDRKRAFVKGIHIFFQCIKYFLILSIFVMLFICGYELMNICKDKIKQFGEEITAVAAPEHYTIEIEAQTATVSEYSNGDKEVRIHLPKRNVSCLF